MPCRFMPKLGCSTGSCVTASFFAAAAGTSSAWLSSRRCPTHPTDDESPAHPGHTCHNNGSILLPDACTAHMLPQLPCHDSRCRGERSSAPPNLPAVSAVQHHGSNHSRHQAQIALPCSSTFLHPLHLTVPSARPLCDHLPCFLPLCLKALCCLSFYACMPLSQGRKAANRAQFVQHHPNRLPVSACRPKAQFSSTSSATVHQPSLYHQRKHPTIAFSPCILLVHPASVGAHPYPATPVAPKSASNQHSC